MTDDVVRFKKITPFIRILPQTEDEIRSLEEIRMAITEYMNLQKIPCKNKEKPHNWKKEGF